MAKEFRLPDLGEGVHEGQVIRLLVAEGEMVKEDQPLMEVETDKAAVEIPSPVSGTIAKWHVQEKQVVNVGQVMVTFGQADAAPEKPAAAQHSPAASIDATPQRAQATPAASAPAATAVRKPASPAVRKLARQLGVNIDDIQGTGPAGRISRDDVLRAAEAGQPASAPATAAPAPLPAKPATPAAAPTTTLPATDDSDQYGPIHRVPITQARKTIASVMSQSAATIPHVTDCDDADITELDKLRRDYAASQPEGQPKLTILAFLIRAVVRALQAYPEFNASFDADNQQIIYRHFINIAVGVHTERGLIAPVIRNTDQLDVPSIARALDEIVAKARSGTFTVNDTRGGTYTISNAGAFGGSRYSTPLITPPQVAVLAAGRSRWMPWVIDGQIQPRLILPLSHSIDHRLLDGGQEITFMKHVITDLQHPGRLIW